MATRVFGTKDDEQFWSDKPIQKGHPDYKEIKNMHLSAYTEVTFSGGDYPIEIESNKGLSEHYNSMILSKDEAKALKDFLNGIEELK